MVHEQFSPHLTKTLPASGPSVLVMMHVQPAPILQKALPLLKPKVLSGAGISLHKELLSSQQHMHKRFYSDFRYVSARIINDILQRLMKIEEQYW